MLQRLHPAQWQAAKIVSRLENGSPEGRLTLKDWATPSMLLSGGDRHFFNDSMGGVGQMQ